MSGHGSFRGMGLEDWNHDTVRIHARPVPLVPRSRQRRLVMFINAYVYAYNAYVYTPSLFEQLCLLEFPLSPAPGRNDNRYEVGGTRPFKTRRQEGRRMMKDGRMNSSWNRLFPFPDDSTAILLCARGCEHAVRPRVCVSQTARFQQHQELHQKQLRSAGATSAACDRCRRYSSLLPDQSPCTSLPRNSKIRRSAKPHRCQEGYCNTYDAHGLPGLKLRGAEVGVGTGGGAWTLPRRPTCG